MSNGNKWDDDETERPAVPPAAKSAKDMAGDLNDWQARVNAAAKAVPEASPIERPRPAVKMTTTIEPKDGKPPAPRVDLPQQRIEQLAREAQESAKQVAARAGKSKKVRLRIKVSGWYEGSVPAVDYCDGKRHYFAHAPSIALDTFEEYMEHWRKPFVAHLKKLGFDVLEEDI